MNGSGGSIWQRGRYWQNAIAAKDESVPFVRPTPTIIDSDVGQNATSTIKINNLPPCYVNLLLLLDWSSYDSLEPPAS